MTTNHITAVNLDSRKWDVFFLCKDVCVDWQMRLETAMQMFTYESESIENSVFSFLWNKLDSKISESL